MYLDASCGGTVVEFHGDGMMAAFGAPELTPQKERAAVQAARAIVAAVATLLPVRHALLGCD